MSVQNEGFGDLSPNRRDAYGDRTAQTQAYRDTIAQKLKEEIQLTSQPREKINA